MRAAAATPLDDTSREIITIMAQLLVLVIRLGPVERRMMMIRKKKRQQTLERVIYEAQELARRRNWSVSFTLSTMWSRFKSAGEHKEAEAAFILMQRKEERKGVGDPIFSEW